MEQRQFSSRFGDFQQFLTEFSEELKEKRDYDDSVTIRLTNPRISQQELEGECLEWCLDFLSTRGCPLTFAALIAREVYQQVIQGDLDSYITEDEKNDNPRIETEREDKEDGTDDDTIEELENRKTVYCAEKLQGHVISILEAVCQKGSTEFPDIQVDGDIPVISFHCIKNTRRKMEDKHVILPDLNALFNLKGHPPQSFFGVFDGHAGIEAALFTSKHIHCNLVHHCDLEKNPVDACKNCFRVTDEQYIPKAKKERWRSGCTGVTALVRGNKIYLSWLGDSQASLVKNGKVVTRMEPHKPDRQDERERIESQGGFVILMGDMWRVGGNLAVSRAIGDVGYKPFISSEAEVLEIDLDDTVEYMVLACDGLWDVVTDEELPRLVYNFLLENNNDRHGVAKYLVQYAKENESQDNISVIVVFFRDTISEPSADGSLFNFLGGDSQGLNDSGENTGRNSDGDNSGSAEQKGQRSQGQQKNSDRSDGSEKNQKRQFDHAPEENMAMCEEGKKASGPHEILNNQSYQEDSRGLRMLNHTSPEIMIDFSVDNANFEVYNAQKTEQYENNFSNCSDHGELNQGYTFGKEEDLDCYGVFNTRLLDGPIDLSIIDDQNSSYLLKDIADSLYNQDMLRRSENHYHTKNTLEKDRIKDLQPIELGPIGIVNSGLQKDTKKVKKVKYEGQRSRKKPGKKDKGLSPVFWAFTGRNQASVQNHRLNLAAKSHKESNPTLGEETLACKAPPKLIDKSNKLAQLWSPTENVHKIANVTLSHGKLESLPTSRVKESKTMPSLPAFTLFGSKASFQKESQKFHTTLRPRKPLKPITTVVYETPPTPFVSSKIHWARQQ